MWRWYEDPQEMEGMMHARKKNANIKGERGYKIVTYIWRCAFPDFVPKLLALARFGS